MKALLFLISLLTCLVASLPATAQTAEDWNVEKGSRTRAATLERVESSTLSYGFSCWKKTWVFFFNHQADEGGVCADHAACERDVAEVRLNFKVTGAPDRSDIFNLFENYYFQETPLDLAELKLMLDSKAFGLTLDEKLKSIWKKSEIYFSLEGFEAAVNANKKDFSCPLRPIIPKPLPRPSDAVLAQAAAPPPRTAAKKAYTLAAKKMNTAKKKKAKPAKAKSRSTKKRR